MLNRYVFSNFFVETDKKILGFFDDQKPENSTYTKYLYYLK